MSAIMGGEFIEMVRARTYSALETRARDKRPTGGRAYGYSDNKVDPVEAAIVQEIFGRFADGASTRIIAADLNGRLISSPGSSWNRTTRRASGWMGSGVRVIVRNERYRGLIHWNTSEWRKDPDSGKRERHTRPRSEWITRTDESLRIVSDDLFARAQRRMCPGQDRKSVQSGGKAKYLLSGLLRCDVCQAHYIGVNGAEYGCSSHRDGGACSNGVRVRRDHAEDVLPGRLRSDLLAPQSVKQIAQDMQAYFLERSRALEAQAIEAPRELQELTARITRLRERLKAGDPDMPADELQAAIDRAEAKRQALLDQQPAAKHSAKVLKILPQAARREIAAALGGCSPRIAQGACDPARGLRGEDSAGPDAAGGLVAHWNLQTAALLGIGTVGSGGSLCRTSHCRIEVICQESLSGGCVSAGRR
jgi:hypothetical protein